MPIKFSRRANADLEEIYHYGVQHFGVTQTDAYHNKFYTAFLLLEENPLLSHLRMEFTRPVRIHPWRSHSIVYVADSDGIFIVRILHGTSDMKQHLSSLK